MNLKINDKVKMISHEGSIPYGSIGKIIEIGVERKVALVAWENFCKKVDDSSNFWVIAIKRLEKIPRQLEFEF